MSNNHKQETREGLYTRVSVLLAAIVGAYAILGEPIMIIPIFLFVVAWIFGAWEIYIQAQKRHWRKLHWLSQIGAFIIFGFFVYSAYFIFLVNMNVRFITGGPMTQNNRTFEALRFAVQLTNRGKPTSLTSWKAHLTLDDGRVFSGEVQYLDKDGAEIEDANHNKIIYAIPECDLTVETVRAMQTGDSVFGIIAFGFFDLPSGPVPLNTKVTLQATDMLGRTIKSQEIQFAEVNKNPRDVFPCPVK